MQALVVSRLGKNRRAYHASADSASIHTCCVPYPGNAGGHLHCND